jgi:LPXTG-motif cell wall-anchored protein
VVVTFTVPKDLPAGLYHVILTGLTSGHTATVAFTVTAAVPPVLGYTGDTVDPASGIIGMSIVLLGLVLVMGVRARKRLQRRRAA